MAETDVRIRVGAVADPSLRTALRPFEEVIARAQRKAGEAVANTSKARRKGLTSDAAEEAKALAQRASVEDRFRAQQVAKDLRAFDQKLAAARSVAREAERLSQREARAQERALRHVAGIRDRYFRDQQRQEERAQREMLRIPRARSAPSGGAGVSAGRQFAHDVVGGVSRDAHRAIRGAVGVGRDVASGLGVQIDPSSLINRQVTAETASANATISAFGAQGKNAAPEDVAATLQAVRAAAKDTRADLTAMAAGLEDFVTKSADLDTGKKLLGDMGRLAKATGSDLQDLISTAGDVTKSFDAADPEKYAKTLAVMRLFAAQGSMGNVEIKDLAKFGGRLTGAAAMYEGDRAQNIGMLGAMAQISMKGGRINAAEATNSASAFGRDITKSSALSRFDKEGIEIFSDKTQTKVRSPEAIIVDVLRKTGGDQGQIANLFQNVNSKAPVLAAADVYNEAGGGEAGEKAVRDLFQKFSTTIDAGDVMARFDTAMDTSAGKAQAFQNELDATTAKLMMELGPELTKLTPKLVELTGSFAEAVTWASENPGQLITMAIVGSISKAALGATVRLALEQGISGATGGKGKGAAGAAGVGGIGNVGTALAITAAAVTITAAGVSIIDSAFDAIEKDQGDAVNRDIRRTQIEARGAAGRATPEELAELEGQKRTLQQRIDAAGKDDPLNRYTPLGPLSGAANFLTAGSVGTSFDAQQNQLTAANNIDELRAEMASVQRAIDALGGKTLNVNVVNPPAAPGPPREGPP